jgi:hypothetical protein
MHDLVFLFDVDNTLLDNDSITADFLGRLEREFGRDHRDLYLKIFEELRRELGYADYLGALQRYRLHNMHDPRVLRISSYLVDYPFAERLFPMALQAVDHCKQWGPAVVLSDGDVVFQPRKVARSGIGEAVNENVLIYIHKEEELADVERRYPARRYVMVDDKVRLLAAIKAIWKDRVTTVFPRQGHYAHDAAEVAKYPPPDIVVDSISDLLSLDLKAFVDRKAT